MHLFSIFVNTTVINTARGLSLPNLDDSSKFSNVFQKEKTEQKKTNKHIKQTNNYLSICLINLKTFVLVPDDN